MLLSEPLNGLQSHFKIVAVQVHGCTRYIVVHNGSINFVLGRLILGSISSKVINKEASVVFKHFRRVKELEISVWIEIAVFEGYRGL